VAIAGILAAIAIPNYRKHQMRARQAEAKVSLGAVYLAETTAMQDQHSFTACFGTISGRPPGLEYYAVGFSNGVAAGPNCSPYGAAIASMSCLNYAWVNNGGVVTAAQSCTAGQDQTYFAAVSGNLASSNTAAGVGDLVGGALTWQTFRVRAAGNVGYEASDLWEMDHNKSIYQVRSGLTEGVGGGGGSGSGGGGGSGS
jgi:type IV pilus assembly protein PilA